MRRYRRICVCFFFIWLLSCGGCDKETEELSQSALFFVSGIQAFDTKGAVSNAADINASNTGTFYAAPDMALSLPHTQAAAATVFAPTAPFFSEDLVFSQRATSFSGTSQLSVASALLFSLSDQSVLYAENIYTPVYPASTTKLMTALLVYENANLTDEVTVFADNAGITRVGAQLCGFQKGDRVTVDTLLHCMMIYSGNDAAALLATHIAGSEEAFVRMMNERAAALLASDTHFTNMHGLHDAAHKTTAYDMYLIFQACLKQEGFAELIQTAVYSAAVIDAMGVPRQMRFCTTNLLLWDEAMLTAERELFPAEAEAYLEQVRQVIADCALPEALTVIGGKTGSTAAAGDCLVLLAQDAEGREYVAALFGAADKQACYLQMKALLLKILE